MSPRRRPTNRRPKRPSRRPSKAKQLLERFKGKAATKAEPKEDNIRRKPPAPSKAEPKMTPAERKAKAREARLAALKSRPKKKTRGSADTTNIVSTAGPRPKRKTSVTTRMTPAERKDKARKARLAALKARPKTKTRTGGTAATSTPGPRPSDPKNKTSPPSKGSSKNITYFCNGRRQGTPCKKSTGGSPKPTDRNKKTKALTVEERKKSKAAKRGQRKPPVYSGNYK